MARRHGRLRKGQLDSVKRIELLIHCLGWTRSEYFSDYHVCLESVSGYLLKVSRVWISRGKPQAIA